MTCIHFKWRSAGPRRGLRNNRELRYIGLRYIDSWLYWFEVRMESEEEHTGRQMEEFGLCKWSIMYIAKPQLTTFFSCQSCAKNCCSISFNSIFVNLGVFSPLPLSWLSFFQYLILFLFLNKFTPRKWCSTWSLLILFTKFKLSPSTNQPEQEKRNLIKVILNHFVYRPVEVNKML